MNRRSASVMNYRNRAKLKLIEYKGGKCKICGYDKPIPAVYDFHHVDPKQKDFQIGGSSFSFEKLKKESDKCILLCRNCHSELHWNLQQEARKQRIEDVAKKRLEAKICEQCHVEFQPVSCEQIFCSQKCHRLKSRKVTRPKKQQLQRDIDRLSWVAIGKKYGVSDNAVRKWARSYGLL